MRRSVAVLAALLLLPALAGCSYFRGGKTPLFDGYRFSASARAEERRVPERFVVVVRDAAKAPGPAREAGRFEATRYCVNRFGTSDIDWAVGPDDEGLQLVGGDLVLRGTCLF